MQMRSYGTQISSFACRRGRQSDSALVEEVWVPPDLKTAGLRSFRFRPGNGVTKLALGANADFAANSVDVVVSSPVLQDQALTLELDLRRQPPPPCPLPPPAFIALPCMQGHGPWLFSDRTLPLVITLSPFPTSLFWYCGEYQGRMMHGVYRQSQVLLFAHERNISRCTWPASNYPVIGEL